MDTLVVKKRRARGSKDPYLHYSDNHIVRRKESDGDYEIVRTVFGNRRRYSCPYFAGPLVGRTYDSIRHSFTRLTEMGVLQLCERQRENVNERIFGTLYRELGPRGREIAAEMGIDMPRYHDDKIFPHTLMLDQVTASIEIGVREQDEITLEYRDDLPRHYPLKNNRRLIPDNHRPIKLSRKDSPIVRHIAGIEVETGSNRVTTKDTDATAVVKKFEAIIELIEDGTLENLFGKQFFFLFVFGGKARKEWAMENLLKVTQHEDKHRRHFAFKAPFPVYGKRLTGTPNPTGHMATEPWDRLAWGGKPASPFYLLPPKEASSA